METTVGKKKKSTFSGLVKESCHSCIRTASAVIADSPGRYNHWTSRASALWRHAELPFKRPQHRTRLSKHFTGTVNINDRHRNPPFQYQTSPTFTTWTSIHLSTIGVEGFAWRRRPLCLSLVARQALRWYPSIGGEVSLAITTRSCVIFFMKDLPADSITGHLRGEADSQRIEA